MNTAMSNPPPHPKMSPFLRFAVLVLLASMLFALFAAAATSAGPWFWFSVFLAITVLWFVIALERKEAETPMPPPAPPRMITPEEQPGVVRDVMDVQLAAEEEGVRLFRGRLRESPDAVFARLKAAFGPESTPLLQKDPRCEAAIVLVPVAPARSRRHLGQWANWLLFAATLATTTWAGAMHQGVDLLRQPERFAVGLPYAIGLLAILGVHELGHYWVARRNGMDVTPPFFVPVPFALGTFGAFIRMRSPPEDRRSLFDVAVAGPLAGLAVAIPALVLGLRASEVLPGAASQAVVGGTMPGSSILFTALAHLALGGALAPGDAIRLSPLAFAGWLGLLVTGLNLLPIGQLDGGHIARAMFGPKGGELIGALAMWSLVVMGLFVWPGLLTWAVIVFFLAGRGTPPLNDLTPVTPFRYWLGALAFVLLFAIMVPASAIEWLAGQFPYL